MTDFNTEINTLIARIMKHEGFRSKPYRDTVGKLTIGYGRNLDDVGISEKEAVVLLGNDVMKVAIELDKAIQDGRIAKHMEEEENMSRLFVVLEMMFNLGIAGFFKFKETIKAINEKNWEYAAQRMLKSKWASQVGKRANTLAEVMRTGKHEQ